MLPIYQTMFYKKSPRLSKEAREDILLVEKWFGEELFTYIRVFGSITTPHVLAYYVPDKLLARDIAYQTMGDGITKTLKEQKKSICLTFLLQCSDFSYMILGTQQKRYRTSHL